MKLKQLIKIRCSLHYQKTSIKINVLIFVFLILVYCILLYCINKRKRDL